MLTTRKLFCLNVGLDDALVVPCPSGERRFVAVTGGSVIGDCLSGEILPGGSDVQRVRADGVVELDIRAVLLTSRGTSVYLRGQGLRHGPPGVMDLFATGADVPADSYYFRECLFFETDDPELVWLTRVLTIGSGRRSRNAATIDVFEVC
ncbi:DUF3237 domain-containing protein [Mycobacterium aquaticum]|uniref:Uncharacterized protein n=1 Tax=Mycobacterium aquaticum TaxID=1927124 RepID=A0A1X0AWR5_9MYCO|nr:hypothetical protein BST13_17370 [Mycobacterium aquaticum]